MLFAVTPRNSFLEEFALLRLVTLLKSCTQLLEIIDFKLIRCSHVLEATNFVESLRFLVDFVHNELIDILVLGLVVNSV
jgi:hypothetical protein